MIQNQPICVKNVKKKIEFNNNLKTTTYKKIKYVRNKIKNISKKNKILKDMQKAKLINRLKQLVIKNES